MNAAIPTTWEDRWNDLGKIPLDRILMNPPPGMATIEDVIRLRDTERRLVELVDATLVEKAMGWRESLLASVLIQWLRNYLDIEKLGVVTGADGMTRLFADTVRGPDVAFVAWDRLPKGRIPETPIPDLAPNFVIEVLSVGNTYAEMSRKRREYFHAGVQLVWMVDPQNRTITVYRASNDPMTFQGSDTMDAAPVLPAWKFTVSQLFDKLDETIQRD